MKRAWALALLLLVPAAADGRALDIAAEPISSFQRFFSPDEFGPFAWRGGLTLSSDKNGFGGLSGLVIDGNCEDLLAVSDSGNWLRARLRYEEGKLAGIADAEMQPVLGADGKRQRDKAWVDAESLTPLGNGKVGIAFERHVRFGAFDVGKSGLAARFKAIPHPKSMDQGPENGEIEAFGALPGGGYIAIAERQYDDAGNIRAWGWRGWQTTPFLIKRHDEYNVTDLVVTPRGDVLTLERRFSETSLPGFAVRRFSAAGIGPGKVIEPELLLEASAPLYIIDNMEGMALCSRDGETRLTLVSDDNFNRSLQSTILLQFAYRP